MNGIINVFKPEGITSYDVIRLIKRIADQQKIGHSGTLDPSAQGVLPLFLGKMTKLISLFNQDNKTYNVTARFGAKSSTLDREGEIVEVPIPEKCDQKAVNTVLKSLVGEIEQIPPMYSAVKVKGRKLYQYAREGREITRKSRKITVLSVSNIRCKLPTLNFDIQCSKGTYIRTLVDDVAKKLGTSAYLTSLTRTSCGRFFKSENALKFDQIKLFNKIDLQRKFIDPECLLPEWHLIIINSQELWQQIRQGRAISILPGKIHFSDRGKDSPKAMVKDKQNELLAIGILEFSQDSCCNFRPEKVFI